ncbi:filamentous hemagglutinin N-terminal domain-containing protein [Variovorax sp. LT2P21]|uniref:two-partner secretion domain-containing protein n=1 Tax=Variovorax sp. LT2P21 TaxID=3443731 RepID=UPI003F489F07
MNKHLHRIVFNAARGLRMVVQETARSTGRGARKATSGGAGASSAAVSVAALAGALMSAPLHAQIVADPGAPGGQRPTVLAAPNGVPLVNIQTPSAAGVSRNTYSQFDVQRNGVVLNNSRGNAQTQLGGWVQGNPWLATGSARVILNEVNSANPSQLRGYVEVAGPRTEVIIANPAGIQVDGGGFINTTRATLTTGTPQFNAQGGLDSFVVRGGTVSIDGAGLDASKTDYAAILARAVQVNAGIWANELKVVTGANQVSADSSQASPTTGNGTAPSFALDVAALGGMYAGKITLVGTEAGVGVRNAGHIGAGAGGLVVTAAGRLENTGTLEGAKVELSGASDIDNRGGTIRQAGTRDISVTAPVLSNTNGGVIGAEPVATTDPASGTPGTDTGATGSTPTTGTTTGTATTTAGITEVTPLQPAAATGPGAIAAAGSVLNDGGRIYAGGEIGLNTPRIDNTGGSLSVGTMAVTGDRFSNAGGTLNVSRDFSARVGSFDNSGGTLQAGQITIDATGSVSNQAGSLVSNADLSVRAASVDNASAGTVRAGNDLNLAVAGTLLNEGSITAGRHASVTAARVDSTAKGVLGAGVHSNGALGPTGDLTVTTMQTLAAHGSNLAGGNAVLQGSTIDLDGSQTHATDLTLSATQGDITTRDATVVASGTLTATANSFATQALRNDKGTISAGQLVLRTANLSNTQGGAIVQTGNGATAIEIAGDIDNSGGKLTAVGDLAARAGGAVRNLEGTIAANGDVRLDAGSLVNTQGTIRAVKGALQVATTSTTSNTGGTLQAAGAVVLRNAGFTNSADLVNIAGQVVGHSLSIDTQGQTLGNRQGTLAATTTVSIASGAFDNTAGLVQSGGAMVIDTHGQALTNTQAANYETAQGGITSAGTLDLFTGAVDNTGGFIGSKGDLRATTTGVVNGSGGIVLGQSALALDTQGGLYDNRGGQTQSIGALRIDAGVVNNSGSLIRSLETATLNAATVTNTNTQGAEQGIEGRNVVINTGALKNASGAIRADADTTIVGNGQVDNTGGLISARGTLRIADPNPSARTLAITNTGGTLVADQAMQLQAASLSGDGKVVSGKDLELSFSQDLVNNGEISANGNLTYASSGNLTNNGKLLAGGTLAVSGNNVENTANAEMRGDTTIVTAAATLTNRGLIDGRNTQINAGALVNDVTGRIYGDHVSIAAGAVLNDGDGTHGGTIAARGRLDIGANTVINREHALIFSGTEMAIGAALDANREAIGQAALIHNASATIESLGDMRLSAATIRSSNEHLNVQREVVSSAYKQEIIPLGETQARPASDYVVVDNEWIWLKLHPEKYGVRQVAAPTIVTTQSCSGSGDNSSCSDVTTTEPRDSARFAEFKVTPPSQTMPMPQDFGCSPLGTCPAYEAAYTAWNESYATALAQLTTAIDTYNAEVNADNAIQQIAREWTELNYTETLSRDVVTRTDPAKIVAGGNMTLSGQLVNADSQVLAGGTITTDQAPQNTQSSGAEVLSRDGKSITRRWEHHGGLNPHVSHETIVTAYAPADSVATFALPGWRYDPGVDETSGPKPDPVKGVSVNDHGSAAGTATASGRGRTFTEVPSTVKPPDTGTAATDAPLAVRTSTPDTGLPSASLFRTTATGNYLIETDPRFASYRSWLSSDYMLTALGLEPNNMLKRLGDGFYEQKLIREQIAQLTGYRYLGGFTSDTDQYTALMNAGLTFAQQYSLRPGIALSEAQMAQLTSDIVWLVEREVTLADGSTQRVLVPQVYVRVKPGDIDGSGGLLSADALVIQGGADGKGAGDLINTGTLAGRTLVSINADNVNNLGGRIAGGSVGINARNDLNNIGGSIEARSAAVLTAGRDINIRTTTSTQTSSQGSRTNIDRVAGVYVTNPGGTLIASAGNDVNIVGAILSNTGANSVTRVHAGNDIHLGTVTTSNTQDITWNSKNYRHTAETQEIGSQIVGGSGAGSSVMLDADRDIVARQAAVQTGGLLSVHADRDIDIQAGRRTQEVDDAHQVTTRGFLSKKTTTSRTTLEESISQGSSFQGGITAITAGGNITGEGVKIRGDEGVLVQAGGVLDLHEARDVRSESREVSVKKSGFGLGGGSLPMVVPKKSASRDTGTSYSDTAAVTSIESKNGGVLLQGDQLVALQGVQVDAAKDVTIRGGTVSITGAINESASTSEHYQKKLNLGTETWWRDPGTGIGAKRTDADQRQETSLVRSTLNGANVSITATGADGTGGLLAMSGTTINTPGKLTLEADQLVLGTQTTQIDQSSTSQGRDLMWQKAKGEGTSDQTTHYNQFNAGQLATNVNSVQAGLGARDSIESLAQQPGMGWVSQINSDPTLAGKVDWVKVEEAHTKWDYKQQGLTPEGAAIVTLVAAYFAYPAAQAAGASAGAAVGGGMAGTVTAGAVTAGFTTLASQVAVAVINNRGNLGDALHDLGSSENVKGLLTAIITGGVLQGLGLSPTGQPTVGGGAQRFIDQLGQNLQVGAAKAVIGTAINGGSFEDNLKNSLKSAILDTAAAQTAFAIGDLKEAGVLDRLTQGFAHAVAGCAIGALTADSGSACGAGALGAAIGGIAAEAYGSKADTVQFAAFLGGLAAAAAGGDAALIDLAGQAAANVVANNHQAHPGWGYEYPEVDHPFAPTDEFKARFFGSEAERAVWFRTQEIAAGTAQTREWLQFDDPKVQLPRSGGPLYQIFDLGGNSAGAVRIAYSPRNPSVFYVSLDHYGSTSAQPLRWTRFEATSK